MNKNIISSANTPGPSNLAMDASASAAQSATQAGPTGPNGNGPLEVNNTTILVGRDISHQPRILSLDGGGVRGLSSLVILEEIMKEIKHRDSLAEVPLPCEYFDLIGGTSTGGLIAIMLGRLRMVCPACPGDVPCILIL